MLQPDAFCDHAMLEELTAFPQTQWLILRRPLHNTLEMALALQPSDAIFGYRGGKGEGKKGKGGKGTGKKRGRGREREESGRGGREGEGIWNKAAVWLRPAVSVIVTVR